MIFFAKHLEKQNTSVSHLYCCLRWTGFLVHADTKLFVPAIILLNFKPVNKRAISPFDNMKLGFELWFMTFIRLENTRYLFPINSRQIENRNIEKNILQFNSTSNWTAEHTWTMYICFENVWCKRSPKVTNWMDNVTVFRQIFSCNLWKMCLILILKVIDRSIRIGFETKENPWLPLKIYYCCSYHRLLNNNWRSSFSFLQRFQC